MDPFFHSIPDLVSVKGEVMECVFSYHTENPEDCQFLMSDILKTIKYNYKSDTHKIKLWLKNKYEDEIFFF